ncbi:MAG: GGDEF domain-containing protein [Pyrinomonadaceae bacterium]|nr:GGDEF domain-containing protein [Pyrinomonadaceae bacterium]
MKHVIVLSGDEHPPSPSLLEVLHEAGVTATLVGDADLAQAEQSAPDAGAPPLALLYEIAPMANVVRMHATVSRARVVWPDTPLVAFRRSLADERMRRPQRIDDDSLARLGFRAVAEGSSQLPTVLRMLKKRGAVAGKFWRTPVVVGGAPLSAPTTLPEKLDARRLRVAFETVAALHLATDQQGAAVGALAGLAALVHAERWSIYIAGEVDGTAEADTLEPLAVHGVTARERALPDGDWRRALLGTALALVGGESQAARDAFKEVEPASRQEGEQYTVAAPLVSGERVLGVLEAVRDGADARAFNGAETALLAALAHPLAAALANSQRIAEAERLSLTDDLTKLNNARFLRQYLISEIKRARRYGSSVSALFLDLDNFKQINDQHGHLVGSHVLMETAAVILASVRDTDMVARYGGDEFVAILPETPLEQAARVAERVRERIAGHFFTGGGGLQLRLTASFGIATFPQHAQSPQQLIASADAAMYDAKNAQKNCIRFASVPSPADIQ